MTRISNVTYRNVSLMFSIAFFCGLVFCGYHTISTGSSWIGLCPVIIATATFLKFYLIYRKEVNKGNIYGRISHRRHFKYD